MCVIYPDYSYFFRCLLRDKEVDCREKDTEIRDLKEKVVKLTGMARHLEMQKAELFHQVKLQVSSIQSLVL